MAFKTFTDTVLPSSDINTYLMKQAVIVATTATRPSSPIAGMTIYNTTLGRHEVYTGSAWITLLNPRTLGVGGTYFGGTPAAGSTFLMQAGSSVVTLDGAANAVVNFPAAFPTGVVSVVSTNGDGAAQAASVIYTGTPTLLKFDIHVASGLPGPYRLNWIAFGW